MSNNNLWKETNDINGNEGVMEIQRSGSLNRYQSSNKKWSNNKDSKN